MLVSAISETSASSKQPKGTSKCLFLDFLTHGLLMLKSSVFLTGIITLTSSSVILQKLFANCNALLKTSKEIEAQKFSISKTIREHHFSGMFLNELMTESLFFHWLTFMEDAN